jgi:transcriptional regulator with XRE-family HTH domain
MMARPVSHPDDIAARDHIRRRLRALRRDLGVRVEDLADAAGVTTDAIYLYEQRATNPLTGTVQRHAGGLNHRLVMRLAATPALPTHPYAVNLLAMAAATSDGATADAHQRAALLADLVAYRRWLGLTAREITERCGCSRDGTWASQLEAGRKQALLGSYQRYARALGGHLHLDLEPLT